MENVSFLEALCKSGRSDVLQRTIEERICNLEGPSVLRGLGEGQRAYAAAMMSAMLSGVLMTYVAHGKKETADELYEMLLESMSKIVSYLAEGWASG